MDMSFLSAALHLSSSDLSSGDSTSVHFKNWYILKPCNIMNTFISSYICFLFIYVLINVTSRLTDSILELIQTKLPEM